METANNTDYKTNKIITPLEVIGPFKYDRVKSNPFSGDVFESKDARTLSVIACDSAKYIGDRIVSEYNGMLGKAGSEDKLRSARTETKWFADGMPEPQLIESVSKSDVYVIGSMFNPKLYRESDHEKRRSINDLFTEFKAYIRTAKRHSANNVTGIMLYDGYGRSDKREKGRRKAVMAKQQADEIAGSGVNGVITFNFHDTHISEYYENVIGVDEINAFDFFAGYFSGLRSMPNLRIIGPDRGSVENVGVVAHKLDLRYGFLDKRRKSQNEVEIKDLVMDPAGVDTAIFIDDIVDTAGSLIKGIDFTVKHSNIRRFKIASLYPLLNGKAVEKLCRLYDDGILEEFVTLNTVEQRDEVRKLPFYTELDVSRALALIINRRHYGVPLAGVRRDEDIEESGVIYRLDLKELVKVVPKPV